MPWIRSYNNLVGLGEEQIRSRLMENINIFRANKIKIKTKPDYITRLTVCHNKVKIRKKENTHISYTNTKPVKPYIRNCANLNRKISPFIPRANKPLQQMPLIRKKDRGKTHIQILILNDSIPRPQNQRGDSHKPATNSTAQ